jgi:hypothetical protein
VRRVHQADHQRPADPAMLPGVGHRDRELAAFPVGIGDVSGNRDLLLARVFVGRPESAGGDIRRSAVDIRKSGAYDEP